MKIFSDGMYLQYEVPEMNILIYASLNVRLFYNYQWMTGTSHRGAPHSGESEKSHPRTESNPEPSVRQMESYHSRYASFKLTTMLTVI